MKIMSNSPDLRVTVRITAALYYRLMSYCREHNQRVSAVVRDALQMFLDNAR